MPLDMITATSRGLRACVTLRLMVFRSLIAFTNDDFVGSFLFHVACLRYVRGVCGCCFFTETKYSGLAAHRNGIVSFIWWPTKCPERFWQSLDMGREGRWEGTRSHTFSGRAGINCCVCVCVVCVCVFSVGVLNDLVSFASLGQDNKLVSKCAHRVSIFTSCLESRLATH